MTTPTVREPSLPKPSPPHISVCSALIQGQYHYFSTLCHTISNISQDLQGLTTLADSHQLTDVKALTTQAKLIINTANKAEIDLLNELKTWENRANYLEILLNKAIRTVTSSYHDTTDYFFQFQSIIDQEKTNLELKTTHFLNTVVNFSGVFQWKDTNFSTSNRNFLEKNRTKSPLRAKISLANGLKTVTCRELNPPLSRCANENSECTKDVIHAEHVFSNSAKCLQNVQNFAQILLFLKLHLMNLDKVLRSIFTGFSNKAEVLSEKNALKTQKNSQIDIFQTIETLKELTVKLENEGNKAVSYIELLPDQLHYTEKTCLNLENSHNLLTIFKENRLKALFLTCIRLKTDFEEITETDGERFKRGMTRRNSIIDLLFSEEMRENQPLLCRFYHLKSVLLNEYKPKRHIEDMKKVRSELETALLGCLAGKNPELAGRIKAYHAPIPRFTGEKTEVESGYESDWDVEIVPTPSVSRSQVSGVSERWSESQLSGSVESLEDIHAVSGLKRVYYRHTSNRSSTFQTAKNTLNRHTKAVYESGIVGWKQSLKDLTASEIHLQKEINKHIEPPWEGSLSPVTPASSCHSKSVSPWKSTISIEKPTNIDDIESNTSHIALEKLRHSRNLTNVIRSTATGRRLEAEIMRDLHRLAPAVGGNLGRHMSVTVSKPSHYLRNRISVVQKNRSMSPFDKIKCVREEFKRYYETVKRPVLRTAVH